MIHPTHKRFYKKNRFYIISLLFISFLVFIFNVHYGRKFETSFIENVGYAIFDFELCTSCKKVNEIDPRQFRTFGVLDWERNSVLSLTPLQGRVYNILLEKGYQPTRWEIVFRGQVTSLVSPPYGNGRAEIHVRFYKDRIFAEYEIGRNFLQHVLSERYAVNEYLQGVVSPFLSHDEKEEFRILTDIQFLSPDEQIMKRIDLNKVKTSPYDSYLLFSWKMTLYTIGTLWVVILGSKGLVVSAFLMGLIIIIFSFFLPGK